MILPIASALLLSLTSSVSAACPGGANSTCLDVFLTDFYGDGWGGVELFVEYPDGSTDSGYPTCENRTVEHELCTDVNGQYYFTAIHPDEEVVPTHSWEVFWRVSNTDCLNNTMYYTGGYNTTMVWDYTDGNWTLVHWENLWDNEKECDACGDASQCKKKKPKKKKKNKKKNGGKGTSRKNVKKNKDDDTTSTDDDSTTTTTNKKNKKNKDDDTTTTDDSNTTTTTTTTTTTMSDNTTTTTTMSKNTTTTSTDNSTSTTGKRYGPPAVNVRVTMYDEDGDGWWQNDYLGSSWYLADDRGEELFYTGTLCEGHDGYCNLCLGDGAYIIRFTGDEGNFTTWDFCGVTGGDAMELSFHIKKGKCIADSLTSLATTCYGEVNSTVTLSGVVALGGLTTEVFSATESNVVARTLARLVDGWSAERISVLSTSLDAVSFSGEEDNRRLSTFTHDVAFEVSFESESTFGVDGRDYASLTTLTETIAETIDEKIENGEFVSVLNNRATLASVVPLTHVKQVELLSLEIASVKYTGTQEMVSSTLVYKEESTGLHTTLSRNYDYTSIVLFFSALAVGFIAFVGIVSNSMMAPYNQLPDDSMHVTDESTMVEMSDMDNTISNPLGRNAALEADTNRVASTL